MTQRQESPDRISSEGALGLGGEGHLVSIKLPITSKCLSVPAKKLVLSKLSKEAG